LNELTILINNFGFEKENSLNKKIILIYHLNKYISEKEKNEFSINLDDDYDKYFIDNLKNVKNNFEEILDKKNVKDIFFFTMFTKEEIDKFINDEMKNIFSSFNYDIRTIKEQNEKIDYVKSVLNIIKKIKIKIKNENIFNLIKNKVLNLLFQNKNNKEKDLKHLNSTILKMLTSSKLDISECNDFYSQLKFFLELEFENSLFSVIKFLENRGTLLPLLSIKENREKILYNEIIQNQIKNLFEKEIRFEQKPSKPVKIQLIHGLTIPFITYYIKEIEKYFDKNKRGEELVEKVFSWIKKNKDKSEIFEDNKNSDKILKHFYYDFLNIYCINFKYKFNLKENPIKFLEFILQVNFREKNKFNDSYYESLKKLNIYNFSEIFVFLECYKDEIMKLFEVDYLLNLYLPKSFGFLKDIIISYFEMEEKEKFNDIQYEVNKTFNILIDSYINLIFNKNQISDLKCEIEKLKIIEVTFTKINKKLNLNNKNLNLLENLIFTLNIIKNSEFQKEDLIEIIDFVQKK